MERYCPFCKKINMYNHFYYCKLKPNDINKNELRFMYIKYNFKIISDKNILYKEYVINLQSLPDIKKKYNIDFKSILFLLDYFNIEKRSSKESAKYISSKKYIKTCEEKYGVSNVSKIESVKESKRKTFIENYGVDNIWKSEEFKKWSIENRHLWALTEDQNNLRIEKQKKSFRKFLDSLNDEEYENYFKPIKEGFQKWLKNAKEEDINDWRQKISYGVKEFWKNLIDEEYIKICDERSEKYKNLTEGQKLEWSERTSKFWKSLQENDKQNLIKNIKIGLNKYWDSIPNGDERRMAISDRYKKFIEGLTDEQKSQFMLGRINMTSKIETKIQNILDDINIPYQKQFFINKTSYDIRLSNTKIIIEVQGDFWHANPKIYESSDVLNHPNKKIKAIELWKKDEKKKINAEKYGYKVVYIWEDEINNFKQNELIKLLLYRIYN